MAASDANLRRSPAAIDTLDRVLQRHDGGDCGPFRLLPCLPAAFVSELQALRVVKLADFKRLEPVEVELLLVRSIEV